jgi:uncharacterized protein YabN with tetrapyrrole methylase and pyrophosphatase domain
MNKYNNDKIKEMIDMYGVEQQKLKCLEEMSELSKELLKNIQGKDNDNLVIDEVKDVYITLEVMKYLYNITDEDIRANTEHKIQRALDGRK